MRTAGMLLAALLALAGCDQPEMEDQPKQEAYEAAEDTPDNASARRPPEGTVPRGAARDPVPPQPEVTLALLERGRDRYEAICAPCHSLAGDGDGMIVRRGYPPPPSFHAARLRQADDRHFYDVITQGYGVMYPYADRVAPEERWAVIAYIRALQLSQHAPVAELPEGLRRQLPGKRGAQ